MNEQTEYDITNIPEDAQIFTQKKDFDPIDPSEMYQVEVSYVSLRDNIFYKPDAEKPEERGEKYQFSFDFVILNEGKYYGRRVWDNTGLAFKPEGKRGPTKLYKIVMAALKKNMNWDECAKFAPDTKTFVENLSKEVQGKQIKIAIENIKKENGKIRTKVTAYNPVKEDLPSYDPEKVVKVNTESVDPNEVDIPF